MNRKFSTKSSPVLSVSSHHDFVRNGLPAQRANRFQRWEVEAPAESCFCDLLFRQEPQPPYYGIEPSTKTDGYAGVWQVCNDHQDFGEFDPAYLRNAG